MSNRLWNWQIDSAPGSPEQNMAADTALLADLAGGRAGQPTVRVYQWDRNAVSIGRLQPEGPARELYPELPIVRRPTGGRAVRHGEDLTISAALCLDWLPQESRSVSASHQLITGCVEAALNATGLEVCFGGCAIGSQKAIINCFDFTASCDLVDRFTGAKLVGSAQRREGDALLQQMSLPLRVIRNQADFLAHLQSEFQQIRFIDTQFTV